MNTNFKKKNYFEKYYFKFMNDAVFGKTMENVQKHRNIKFVTKKEEKTVLCENQIIIQNFSLKSISNRN